MFVFLQYFITIFNVNLFYYYLFYYYNYFITIYYNILVELTKPVIVIKKSFNICLFERYCVQS